MLGEETELERPPAAADYKVLNRIGQGAFGEVCVIKYTTPCSCCDCCST